jgi:hypothetical protein
MGSNPFLSGGTSLAALTTGTFALDVASVVDRGLTPNLPVVVNSMQLLISRLLGPADLNFVPLANPAVADQNMNGFAVTNAKDLRLSTDAAPVTPPTSGLTVYTSGSKLRYKDDAAAVWQVATISDITGLYLPLDGSGTMAGDIKMGGHNVSGFSTLQPSNGVNIGAGLTLTTDPATNTIVGNGATSTTGFGLNTAYGYQAGCNAPGTGSNCAYGALAVASGNSGAIAVGAGSSASGQDSVVLARGGQATGIRSVVIGGNGALNATDHTVMFGDASLVNVRSASTVCDLGSAALPFQTLYLNANVAGPTNSRTADNIMSNAGASTSGNLPSFSGTSGKVLTDSTVAATSVVVGPASATNGAVAIYNGTTGKLLSDGVTLLSALLLSTTAASTYAALAGAAFTGAISTSDTTASTTTGTGSVVAGGGLGVAGAINAGGVVKSTNTTDSTTTGTGAIVSAGGLGVAKAIVSGGAITAAGIIKTNDTTQSTTTGTGSLVLAGGLGIAKNIVSAGTFVTSDTSGSTTTANGSIVTGGGIGLGKGLNAGGAITTTDTTASTSVNTGSVIAKGGLGVAGAVNAGGVVAGTRFEASAPSLFTAATNAQSATVAFTVSTNKLVDIPGFSAELNPASEWAVTTTTGKCTYTGATTKYFKIDILFNIAPTTTSQTFLGYVAKNGNVATNPDYVLTNTGNIPGGTFMVVSAKTAVQMATNDTVQLAIQYGSSVSPTFRDCLYIITPVS